MVTLSDDIWDDVVNLSDNDRLELDKDFPELEIKQVIDSMAINRG